MPFSSYSELQASVMRWMARDDLTDYVPDYITLFEAFINRVLLTHRMSTAHTFPAADAVAELPTDFLSVKSIINDFSGNTAPLQFVTAEQYWRQFSFTEAAARLTSTIYTIEGDFIYLDGSNSTIFISYYQKVPPLTDAAPTNWLLADHPDLYLFGSLTESNAYVQDVQAATLWKARRDELVREMFLQNFRSGGPMAVSAEGATP